jgi:subtilase family serine protease
MEIERVSPRRQGPEGKPDLIPVPDPKLGFCKRRDLKLTVTVKNQGSVAAGPTTTVDFEGAGSASQPTPGLAPGASVDLVFDIPAACFHGDCHFRITVDSGGQVDESDEANNTASGVCIG